MRQKISVINQSSGRYSVEKINGRDHLVTSMVSIEGDSVMNRLFYPLPTVKEAMHQLHMKPAPAGHPQIDGENASAFNPLAINAYSFGGFVRNPTINGKRVINELVIDVEVAKRSDKGKEVIKRVKNGKRIGVSTGLIAEIIAGNGTYNNSEFNGTVSDIDFDHVAVLLDEPPAGENTYTLNHGAYEDKPKRVHIMYEKLETDISELAQDDRIMLSNMNAKNLLAAVNQDVGVERAIEIVKAAGLQVNKLEESKVECFLENQEAFEEFLKDKQAEVDKVKAFIVKNSKMTLEQLDNFSLDSLKNLADSVAPKQRYIPNSNGGEPKLELLDDQALAVGE